MEGKEASADAPGTGAPAPSRPAVPGVRIDRVLGRGASSVVYLGTQTRFGREVAVKVLDLPGQPELEETLFVNECRTLGRLTPHPNIVTVFDAGLCDDGRPYLVAEYLPGGTLAQRLEDTGPLPADEVLRIGVRLCGALQTTHLHGIIHGDLKPQNVMTGRSGEPALADFGVSRFLSTAGASTRLPALTPLYAAPELFDGSGPSPGTDIYGLGSTLFELLDGRPALGEPGDSPLLIVGRLSRGERRELDRTVVPGPLADLIADATATDPGARPASAQEFGDRLRALQRAAGSTVDEMVVFDDLPPAPTVEPGDAAGPDTIEPARTAVRSGESGVGRRRWTRGAVGAALAAVALVGLLWLVRDDGRGGAGADATSTTTTATAAPPTTSGSPTGGIQPDVTYDVDGIESADGDLDARLADAEAIMQPLGPQVVTADLPTREFTAFPAVARYQGFNPVVGAAGCAGIMTRPLTVTGSWEKTASSGEQTAVVLVGAFDTERDAAEWAVALATEAGLQDDECTGFDLPPDRRSPESLQVSHQDVELPGLPDGATYNTWVRPPARDVGGTVWEASALLVRGRYTIVVSVRYDVTDGSPPDALAAIAANVASRL